MSTKSTKFLNGWAPGKSYDPISDAWYRVPARKATHEELVTGIAYLFAVVGFLATLAWISTW